MLKGEGKFWRDRAWNQGERFEPKKMGGSYGWMRFERERARKLTTKASEYGECQKEVVLAL